MNFPHSLKIVESTSIFFFFHLAPFFISVGDFSIPIPGRGEASGPVFVVCDFYEHGVLVVGSRLVAMTTMTSEGSPLPGYLLPRDASQPIDGGRLGGSDPPRGRRKKCLICNWLDYCIARTKFCKMCRMVCCL